MISKKGAIFLLILITIICTGKVANAQIFPNITSQDQISRIQDRLLQKQKISWEKESIRRRKILQQSKRKKRRSKLGKTTKCFKAREFEFSKSEIISKRRLERVTSKYLGQCFNPEMTVKIKEEIQVILNKKGYITSQAIFPNQNISSGIIKLEIIVGKVSNVIFNNDDISDKIQKFMLFGDLSEEVLDNFDINQALYQINKLPSSNAKIKILPSARDGYSDIIVNNEKKRLPIRAGISHDNLGNEFTGVKRTTFTSGVDNLLSLSEVIDLSFTNNLNDNNAQKEIESVTASIRIPFRYYTLSYNYYDTDYMGKVGSQNGVYTINGYSRRKNISLERSIFNEQNFSLNISSSLIQKDTGSETLLTGVVDSNRKMLSILSLSSTISKSFNDFNIYLKPSILQGLKNLNGDKDLPGSPPDQAKNQFRAYQLYLSLQKPIKIYNKRIILSSEFNGQLSRDSLHGSEQFSVGGYYSVRGFRENYISGDHGYYVRNKLSANFGSLISSKIRKLYNISIEPFFDYGAVRDRISSVGGRLSGAGLASVYNSKYFDASLTYSKSLNKSQLIDTQKKENHLIYFQIGTSF